MFTIGDIVLYKNFIGTVIADGYSLALSNGTKVHKVPEQELKLYMSAKDLIKTYEEAICKQAL